MKIKHAVSRIQQILPKQLITQLAGVFAEEKTPWVKNFLIKCFINKFKINMNEAEYENAEFYRTFNEFFTRHIKPETRPVANADICSPVDGKISEIGVINDGQLIQAKGRYYSVKDLLACDDNTASKFTNGKFVTLYLSPSDYHRVHMPVEGELQSMTYKPGKLFSVNPVITKDIPKIFIRNKRVVTFFETKFGLMAMVLVGATIVGSIVTNWHGDLKEEKKTIHYDYIHDNPKAVLKQAAEMGYFKLGSTVILLFSSDATMDWRPDLTVGNVVKVGEEIASRIRVTLP